MFDFKWTVYLASANLNHMGLWKNIIWCMECFEAIKSKYMKFLSSVKTPMKMSQRKLR